MRYSIIVPVYNVERYIEKCLESLVNQTFRDYEIILVDDESPDRSMDIAEGFRARDPERIRIVHQKNTRQGGARNHGVRLARGEYILFVDSDDYVSPVMLETVEKRLRETPCDILAFEGISVTETGEEIPELPDPLQPGTYVPWNHPEVLGLSCTPWGKVCRREFYEASGMVFPEKLLYEDAVTRLLYAKAGSILVTKDRLYYYVHRENSSMTQKISEKMLDIVKVVDLTVQQFREAELYDHFREPLEISLIYSLLCVLDIINLQQPDNPMQKSIADCIVKNFPDYGSNSQADRELIRSLDCLTAHRFRTYHWCFLRKNRMKERLLQNPLMFRLNELRKHR